MTFDEWLKANYMTAGGAPVIAKAAWDAAVAAERDRCVQVATDAAKRYTCATRAKTCLALAGALRSGT